ARSSPALPSLGGGGGGAEAVLDLGRAPEVKEAEEDGARGHQHLRRGVELRRRHLRLGLHLLLRRHRGGAKEAAKRARAPAPTFFSSIGRCGSSSGPVAGGANRAGAGPAALLPLRAGRICRRQRRSRGAARWRHPLPVFPEHGGGGLGASTAAATLSSAADLGRGRGRRLPSPAARSHASFSFAGVAACGLELGRAGLGSLRPESSCGGPAATTSSLSPFPLSPPLAGGWYGARCVGPCERGALPSALYARQG
ncbi:unnamed protein product, partial [Urochloa humidicola]